MEFHSLCLDVPIRDSISSSFIDTFAYLHAVSETILDFDI